MFAMTEKKAADLESGRTFEMMFLKMAKEMLIESAYERIVIATTHRLGDLEDKMPLTMAGEQ